MHCEKFFFEDFLVQCCTRLLSHSGRLYFHMQKSTIACELLLRNLKTQDQTALPWGAPACQWNEILRYLQLEPMFFSQKLRLHEHGGKFAAEASAGCEGSANASH